MKNKLGPDWVSILSKEVTPEPYVNTFANKEQHNGLESLGEVAQEAPETSPMDEAEGGGEESPPAEENPMEDEKEGGGEEEPGDEGEEETPDEDPEDAIPGEEGDPEEGEPGDEGADTGDVGDDTLEDPKDGDISKDPHFIQNRRILLSKKLIILYDSIKDSMELISNGPSFDNKPVIIDQLGELSDQVTIIIESINKEPDYKILLLRYAICVKTYNKIIEM